MNSPVDSHDSRTIGYLGPEGSHSHSAGLRLLQRWPDQQFVLSPCGSLGQLMAATESKEFSLGLIPIENGLEGSVFEVLETLGLQKRNLQPLYELMIPIRHCLIQNGTTPLESIQTVVSHPQALAQCRDTLTGLLGNQLRFEAAPSTSEAVKSLQELKPGRAAVGTLDAAQRYGLNVIRENVSDSPENMTRFFVLHHPEQEALCDWPFPGSEQLPRKTSFCLATANRPGALVDVLLIFKAHQVNMTKIESRPSKKQFGEYLFHIDAEGDLTAPQHQAFLQALTEETASLQVLGPYACLGLLSDDLN